MRRVVFRPEEPEPHRIKGEARAMRDRLLEADYEIQLNDLICAWGA